MYCRAGLVSIAIPKVRASQKRNMTAFYLIAKRRRAITGGLQGGAALVGWGGGHENAQQGRRYRVAAASTQPLRRPCSENPYNCGISNWATIPASQIVEGRDDQLVQICNTRICGWLVGGHIRVCSIDLSGLSLRFLFHPVNTRQPIGHRTVRFIHCMYISRTLRRVRGRRGWCADCGVSRSVTIAISGRFMICPSWAFGRHPPEAASS
jgi:hypothetical protein